MVVDSHPRRADRVFHALSDATRRDIVRRTVRQEHSVSELARAYTMSFAAVQKHVAVLHEAGLVNKRKRGREQLVGADLATLQAARTVLDQLESAWVQRIERMGEILAEETEEGTEA